MAHFIQLEDDGYWVSNSSLRTIFDLTVDAVDQSELTEEEHEFFGAFVERWNGGHYWSGRGLRIEDDFPSIQERKFWARALLDTAQAVYEREIGAQTDSGWQTMAIHQLHKLSQFFIDSIEQDVSRDSDKRYWWPDTRARREGGEVQA